MAIYTYVKRNFSLYRKKAAFYISVCCITGGIGILSWVLYPIISFELIYAPKFNSLVRPIPEDVIKTSVIYNLPQVLGINTIDYTKASVWFPKASNLITSSSINSYKLSIPKLGIEYAQVEVGSEDLSKSLIHFTGPSPGTFGNPVIFGHSTLLWFYNPSEYKSIFSKLPEMKINDDIYVYVDSITYRFKVFEMKIVSPDDLSVLDQKYDNVYLTLVTCVPPGTVYKRLVVKSKLSAI